MQQAQRELMFEQDQHLTEIAEIAQRLNMHAKDIDEQVEHQGIMIKELNEGVDKTQTKLDFVNRKLQVLLKTNDSSQICTILALFSVLIVLVFLVIYT